MKVNFELTAKLREDLAAAYRDVYSHCYSQDEAWRKTINHPAPRFYISPKQAHEILRSMVRGDMSIVDNMRPLKRRMYYDLFATMQKMVQQKEYMGMSLWILCQFLVKQPAPQFYLAVETVRKTLRLSKKYGVNYRHNDIYCQHKKRKD